MMLDVVFLIVLPALVGWYVVPWLVYRGKVRWTGWRGWEYTG